MIKSSSIISDFIYSDRLFFYHLVHINLSLYLSSTLFTSKYFRSPSIISSLHIFLFNFFRTLLQCPFTSFWLSYSVSHSNFQSSYFFDLYSLSLSLFPVFPWYVTLPSSLLFHIDICNNIILSFWLPAIEFLHPIFCHSIFCLRRWKSITLFF